MVQNDVFQKQMADLNKKIDDAQLEMQQESQSKMETNDAKLGEINRLKTELDQAR